MNEGLFQATRAHKNTTQTHRTSEKEKKKKKILLFRTSQTLSVMRMTSIERFTTCTLEQICYFVNSISALLG